MQKVLFFVRKLTKRRRRRRLNLYFPREFMFRIRKVKVLKRINFWVPTAREAAAGESRREDK